MHLNDSTTWPADVTNYLEQHNDLFWAWELEGSGTTSSLAVARARAYQFDRAIYGLQAVLRRYSLEGGYHCTRLTKSEIDHIISNGLQLPSREMLVARIQAIEDAGLVDRNLADRLKSNNQADEDNRAGMIWFCFFSPHVTGQSGIESFFRHWGGEALFNSHERDQSTGPILRKIGTPCVVKAEVPIASLHLQSSLAMHLVRQFLIRKGLKTTEPTDHEDCATYPVRAASICRILQFPEPDFIQLTKCSSWNPPLS
jgi:hypothetical protein